MRSSFKKAAAVVATVGAVALGGNAVANAAAQATIPDVVGMSASEAIQAFQTAGFSDTSVNTTKTDGPVVGTNFQADSSVSENASILIILRTPH